ncbi:MAG TPA: STAS domain-containing protein [Solirubrobacterales bacterium]|jgi:anti-sigma B factor antagonist
MSHLQTFKLTERDLRPGCREIQIEGELDLAVAEQLEQALERAGTECRQILICLEGCGFIDSTGIAAIVHAHKQANSQGGKVAVYAPSDQVLRVLSVTGLTNNGLVFETAEEALSHP